MPPFTDICDLEMSMQSSSVNDNVKETRNIYALRALILFFPFRKLEDLNESETMSYWDKFVRAKCMNQLYSKAVRILQNIQDCHNLKRIVKGDDDIESKTVYFDGIGDFTQNTCCN